MSMHVTNVAKSTKARKLIELLLRRPHTTIELQKKSGLCSISTWISHLRHNGYKITTKQLRGGSDKVYLYTLYLK